ncbi:MAG: hypothetical protein DHS20C06_11940 [Hyphobacterium sp.]|nr:MAG: hypothetical protein DHS20C06_11940 [Hyphobacterium sp.]
MKTFIDAVGQDAETRYQKAGLQPQAFASIASDILNDNPLCEPMSLDQMWQVLDSGLTDAFGGSSKPGLIPLFEGEHVRIVGHLWTDAADRLHQHDWAGAFQLIEGESFNARFDFEHDHDIAEFSVGQLRRTGFEKFGPGSVQPVSSGPSLIHSVVYSAKPGFAISLRVASHTENGVYEYLRPGLRCPSHRRRGMSAMQLDLLAQALQLDEALYAARFAALVSSLPDADILRLIDALAFDGLPIPDEVRTLVLNQLNDGDLLLGSLDDIDRSDRTRELLGEHDASQVRAFICALFHSETRRELAETLVAAGFQHVETETGRALSALIIDDDVGELPPDYLVQALGEAALRGNVRRAVQTMRSANSAAPLLDAHSDFVGDAFGAMEEAPIFRCLFKA